MEGDHHGLQRVKEATEENEFLPVFREFIQNDEKSEEILRCLLPYVDVDTEFGWSPEPESRHFPGGSALCYASFCGRASVCEVLLAAQANVNYENGNKETALLFAAGNGYGDVCKLLSAAGADVNHEDSRRDRALILAAWDGHDHVCEHLLAVRAQVNHANEKQESYLICEALRRIVGSEDPAHKPIALVSAPNIPKTIYRVCLALGLGTTLNEKQESALLRAARNGRIKFVERLLTARAEVNYGNRDNETALMFAASNGHGSVCELLIASGANVNRENKNGTNALVWAARHGYGNICELLLASGADVDKYRGIAHLLATQQGHHKKICDILLQRRELEG